MMNEKKSASTTHMDTSMLWLGHASFILFILFTAFYYKERLLNCDAAYYTFHVINYEEVFVKHQRYISYFTQWAPILVIKLGGSLKMAMIAYSTIFSLWFYGLYLVASYLWKNPRGGLFIAFSLFLTMRYKHYAGHTEITFAIAVASLLMVWIWTDKTRMKWFTPRVDWLIKMIILIWLYIIHPIILLPLLVVLAADVAYHNRWKNVRHWIFILLTLATYITRFLTVAKDSYESGKISLLSTAMEVFRSPSEYYVFQILEKFFVQEYIPVLVLFLLIMVWMFQNKSYLTFLCLTIGSLALIAVIAVTYSYLKGDIYIMIDGYLGMLGMVWGTALYFYMKDGPMNNWKILIIGLLLAFSLIRIYEKEYVLRERLEGYLKTFEMYPDQSKLFAPLNLHDWDKFWYPFEMPVETLMLSSLDGKKNSKTIFVDYDVLGTDGFIEEGDYFISFNQKLPLDKLNPRFFYLPDDQPYIRIEKVSWK
jgi:hypothetical protein